MIKVDIESSGDISDDVINTLYDATYFFIRQLIPQCARIRIDIIIDDDIELRDEGYLGCIEVLKPHHYEIYIDESLDLDEMVISLAHELVHVKQYELRELVELKNSALQWNGVFYSNALYNDAPWEKEAFEKENVLFECYQNWIFFQSLNINIRF